MLNISETIRKMIYKFGFSHKKTEKNESIDIFNKSSNEYNF